MSAGDRDTREFDKFKAERLKDPEIKAAYDAACQATALASLLAEHQIESINRSHVDCWCGWTSEPTPKPGEGPLYEAFLAHLADVLLASDWMADVKAGAWDEGHEDAVWGQHCERHNQLDYCGFANPYRTTENTPS